MNCLILAAGYGSRLRELSDSKPLTQVGGTPLIEHIVRRALAGGATAFTIVTGHEAERVERFAAELGQALDAPIDCVRVSDWDLPNGHSVLAGADAIDGDYLLLMSDHLFDPGIVRALIAAPREAVTLAVDRDLESTLLDIDDATKVATDEAGRIVTIGKTLDVYDAIDTGAFLATPALAEAIRSAVAEGAAGSLSDGMQRLAQAGMAYSCDITGRRWIDVDSPRMHELAEGMIAHA